MQGYALNHEIREFYYLLKTKLRNLYGETQKKKETENEQTQRRENIRKISKE